MNTTIEQPNTHSEGHLEFLTNLQAFGTPTPNRKRNTVADPLKRMKSAFKARAQNQIDIVQSGVCHDGRSWFKRTEAADGTGDLFVVSLRNGTRTLPLAGTVKHIEVKSEALLVAFFKSAISACERGELDHLLLQTAPKQKEVV